MPYLVLAEVPSAVPFVNFQTWFLSFYPQKSQSSIYSIPFDRLFISLRFLQHRPLHRAWLSTLDLQTSIELSPSSAESSISVAAALRSWAINHRTLPLRSYSLSVLVKTCSRTTRNTMSSQTASDQVSNFLISLACIELSIKNRKIVKYIDQRFMGVHRLTILILWGSYYESFLAEIYYESCRNHFTLSTLFIVFSSWESYPLILTYLVFWKCSS